MTFDISDDDVSMDATLDWTGLLSALVALQEQPVTVRIDERGQRIAELRGHLHRSTPASKSDEDSLLLWVGRSLPSVSFAVAREFLRDWQWTEDDGVAELRMQHGPTTIVVDFSPGAGRP
jgi:hypothetical protein